MSNIGVPVENGEVIHVSPTLPVTIGQLKAAVRARDLRVIAKACYDYRKYGPDKLFNWAVQYDKALTRPEWDQIVDQATKKYGEYYEHRNCAT